MHCKILNAFTVGAVRSTTTVFDTEVDVALSVPIVQNLNAVSPSDTFENVSDQFSFVSGDVVALLKSFATTSVVEARPENVTVVVPIRHELALGDVTMGAKILTDAALASSVVSSALFCGAMGAPP